MASLPPGWTSHDLNGRPFYFHAATNTTRPDPPTAGSFEMIRSDGPCVMYAEPASEPLPSGPATARTQAMQPQPTMAHVHATAVTPPPTVTAPPLQPALQLQPGIYSNHAPQPVAQASIVPTATVVAQPAQPMMQLQVLVPEPGLRAGQQLAFTAPAAGVQQAQQMTVTVNQEVVPGSIVTVQYAAPRTTAAPTTMPAGLPQQTVQVDPAEDSRQSMILWGLYGAGFLFICCFGPFAMIFWILSCVIYFCKPASQRAQFPRARVPACTALITCLVCTICGCLAIPVAMLACSGDEECREQMKDSMEEWKRHRHDHHGPWQHMHMRMFHDKDHRNPPASQDKFLFKKYAKDMFDKVEWNRWGPQDAKFKDTVVI